MSCHSRYDAICVRVSDLSLFSFTLVLMGGT